jgi:hypothetical protein
MRTPFVDSASNLANGTDGRRSTVASRLLMLALVVAVAASSAVLLAI